jgi:hypothetical protein
MSVYVAAVVVVLFVLIAIRKRRRRAPARPPRRGSFGVGPGAAGTIYELLNEERRNAIEIIVEDKAAYRDPEDADGNLPDLEHTPSGERRR